MQDLQGVFNKIQESKKRQKDLRAMYKDGLMSSGEYQDVLEKMKSLRETKKRIETAVKEQFAHEITELEDLKIDIESDMEMLSDIALSKLVKGESLELTDADQNNYEPVLTVKFKKMK